MRRMAADQDDPQIQLDQAADVSEAPRRRWWRALFGVAAVLALALIIAWFSRDQIAENLISGQIDRLGLPATYEVESIGTDEQVLRHIVVGDMVSDVQDVERRECRERPTADRGHDRVARLPCATCGRAPGP